MRSVMRGSATECSPCLACDLRRAQWGAGPPDGTRGESTGRVWPVLTRWSPQMNPSRTGGVASFACRDSVDPSLDKGMQVGSWG